MAHAQLARAVHAMRRRGVRRENVRLTTTPTPSSHRAHTELTPSSRRAHAELAPTPSAAPCVHPRCTAMCIPGAAQHGAAAVRL